MSTSPAVSPHRSPAANEAGKEGYPDRSWWGIAKTAALQWMSHKDARLGAALAYYSVFSIGPLIVIAVAVAGLLFNQNTVRNEVIGSLRGLLGDTGAGAVEAMLASASRPREGIAATVIGIGALVFAAIGVVVQLKDALNTVWDVKPSSGGGIWSFARTYVLSLAGVLALGFLLLISLLFAMMFKWLPDTAVSWRDVWFGAVTTAVLFEIGKFLIGLYIGKQGLESTYGAAASIVVVLVWIYYSAQIVLFGAELTNVHAKAQRHPPRR